MGFNCSTDFLSDAKHMNVRDKFTFADIGETAWSHACAWLLSMYHDLRTTGIKGSGFKVLERCEKETEDLLVG